VLLPPEEASATIPFGKYSIEWGEVPLSSASQRHFSSGYEGELPEKFTMQMVYDISLRPHANADGEKSYIVNYKILKNNGTFRRDIGSDEGREYLFTLVEEQGKLVILEMGPYTSYR
jgi:hypothetical protein